MTAAPIRGAPPEIPDYELLRRIGEGSYGEVWLARSVMGTYRAIKIVHRRAFESDRPFEREFEGIKRFEPVSQSNESQLKIFHVGQRAGCFYYVMELADGAGVSSERCQVSGAHESGDKAGNQPGATPLTPDTYEPKTLRGELQRRGRLPVEECLDLSVKLAHALAHLHRHGLVHRDIKPSNIIFVNGLPKLADIGLVAAAEGTLTFVGTEGYLPPEGPGKPPADIFSLGKVLYEISTGQDRNQFPEWPTLWESKEEREAFAEFNEVIVKACAAQAGNRYATAEEMHADLLLLRAGKSLHRVRKLERRLGQLTKIAVAAVALSAVVGAGYFYQHSQTRTAKRLTAQLQVSNGIRLLDEADFPGSLLWFSEALRQEDSCLSAGERKQHRLRIGAVLQQCPSLAQLIVPEAGGSPLKLLELVPQPLARVIAPAAVDPKVADYGGAAGFSLDGRRILISGYGRAVLWCDAETGQVLQRLQHRANVGRATLSGDGRRVLTWLEDTEAGLASEGQVWDLSTGLPLGQPLTHSAPDPWLRGTLSADGTRVLSISGREVRLWDVDRSQPSAPALLHDSIVSNASFSRDHDRVLTTTRKGVVQIWDAITGLKIGAAMNHDGYVWAGFSSDGTRILTRSGGRIHLWNALTAQELWTILSPNTQPGDGLFSADGQRIVLTGWFNGVIQVHDAATGAQMGAAIRQDNGCFSATLSADGTRIASSCGRHVHLWDLRTAAPVLTPIPQNDHCRVQFSPDGRQLLTAGAENDPVIRLWSLRGIESISMQLPHRAGVFHAAISPDGRRLVTASQDQSARLWDASTAKPIGAPLHTHHTAEYAMFAANAANRLTNPVSGHFAVSFPSGLASVSVFHPVLGDKDTLCELHSTNRAVFFAAFAPDSKRVITASYDGTARLWDSNTGHELIPPLQHQGAIFHAAFSHDGGRVVTASADWTAQVWDSGTGRSHGPSLHHQGAVLQADFSPDGRWVATASYDMTAQVWDANTGAKIGVPFKHLNPDGGPVYTVKFSPGRRQLVTASYDGTAQVWDVATGRKTTPPLRHRAFVYHAEFSPDGSRVVTASADQTAQVWNARTGERSAPPMPHAGVVNQAAFSADGQRIVTASFDGSARVWDVLTGQPLTPPFRHSGKVWHAEFSPDGKRVVTAGNDGTARVWPLAEIDSFAPDLCLLAQTLAARQIDHTGSLAPLRPDVLRELAKTPSSALASTAYRVSSGESEIR